MTTNLFNLSIKRTFTIKEVIPYLPALATLTIGLVASAIAIVAIYSNRQLARKKNSLDTVLSCKGDANYRESIKAIHQIHKDPNKEVSKFAYAESATEADADSIRYLLNFYEYLAVGIKSKIYDEPLLKDSMYTSLITVFERCEGFIDIVRKNGQKTAFCNFERLAKKWIDDPISK
jgi:hypothetical protein